MAIPEPELGLDEAGFALFLDRMAAIGADTVSIRFKKLDDRQVVARARQAVARGRGRWRVLVSGRVDLALAAGADGVHLPADGLAPALVRARFPALMLGISAHSVAEIERAAPDCDYALLAPIWATPGKGPPLGPSALADAARRSLPVLALGGVDGPAQVAEAAAAGAAGVAAIRALRHQATAEPLAAAAHAAWGAGS